MKKERLEELKQKASDLGLECRVHSFNDTYCHLEVKGGKNAKEWVCSFKALPGEVLGMDYFDRRGFAIWMKGGITREEWDEYAVSVSEISDGPRRQISEWITPFGMVSSDCRFPSTLLGSVSDYWKHSYLFPDEPHFRALVEAKGGKVFDHESDYYVSEGYISARFNGLNDLWGFLEEGIVKEYLSTVAK